MRRERQCVAGRGYERRGRPVVDRVTETPQETHSVGYPMSQQTNSGFNAPGFSVGSDCPFEITCCDRGTPVSCGRGGLLPRRPSTAVGETHVESFTARCSVSGARPACCLAIDIPEHFSPSL